MVNIQDQIDIFKKEITTKYPDLYVGYTYDDNEDYYHIWHTNSHLQFEDDAFLSFVGNLIRECFYSKDIFNFSFGYDYLEDEKSKLLYEIQSNYHRIIFNFTNQLVKQEPYFYQTINNYSSFNWTQFESIKIAFDTLDSSFELIRQASLSVDVVEDLDKQEEKALAA
jgi:hypothetical protein